ncbi:MAG: hypothetical protein FWH18_12415 [Marinilabiliaceae bacterium]|nr:hypothetical protein [Marinilabiliaceae bacterium]
MNRIVILTLAIVFVGLTSYAQEQYKPVKGNFTTEMQLSLLSINAKIDINNESIDYSSGPLSMQGLRFRYFVSDKLALRASLGLNFNNFHAEREIDETAHMWSSPYYFKLVETGESIEKTSSRTFSIAPGIEYHFGDWERMSLYVGCELFWGKTSISSSLDITTDALMYLENYDDEFYGMYHTEVSVNSENCTAGYNNYYDYYEIRQNAPMFYGVNLLMGMDFYVYQNLYLGAEFGLGYTFNTYLKGSYDEKNIQVITPDRGTPEITEDLFEKKLEDKIKSTNFNVRYNPMIRIGWRF